jgi:hypothetical protein
VDADAAVGAHGEAAAHAVLGVLGADRDDDDLAAVRLREAERLLGRVGVPLVEGVVEEVGIDVPLVLGELDLVAELGDLLYGNDDLQASTASRSMTWRSRAPGRLLLKPGEVGLRRRLAPLAAGCRARGASPYAICTVSAPLTCILFQRHPRDARVAI